MAASPGPPALGTLLFSDLQVPGGGLRLGGSAFDPHLIGTFWLPAAENACSQ